MNKVWHCAALALLLSGCSLPFSLSQPAEPKLETKVPTETTRLKAWLALSERVLHSNDTQRQQAMKLLKDSSQAQLKRALWLSAPKASTSQRQQAQQLFQQHLSKVTASEQQFLSIYQRYNQELLQQQRQLAERQQQVNNLANKLKELANIEQQLNDRKFQE